MELCKIGWFVGGLAAGCAVTKMMTCQKTKDVCIDMLAKGMELKTEAQTVVSDIKQKAEDIYQEAEQQAFENAPQA